MHMYIYMLPTDPQPQAALVAGEPSRICVCWLGRPSPAAVCDEGRSSRHQSASLCHGAAWQSVSGSLNPKTSTLWMLRSLNLKPGSKWDTIWGATGMVVKTNELQQNLEWTAMNSRVLFQMFLPLLLNRDPTRIARE